jgi:putative hydrolase of the HAD superfamily
MRNLKAVFFDMGSTLSHQNPTREELLFDFLAERGHQRTLQDIRRSLLASDTWWHEWTVQNPFGWQDESLRQTMRAQYRQVFMRALALPSDDGLSEALTDLWTTSIMRRHNAIYPDVLPVLRDLRQRGLKLAIVSNWDASLQSHCDDLGLTPLFDTIVGSLAVGYEKPDPRIFAVALERMQERADQVVHVGDIYVSDVVGARRAGITPVLLDRYDLQPDADCLRVRTLDQLLPLLPV